MFIEFVLILILSLFTEILLQHLWMAEMHKMKIEQVTKLYGPCWQEKAKMGTPTMGGIVFIPVLLFALFIAHLLNPYLQTEGVLKVVSYPLLAAAVGFIDDWLKYKKHSSDGLTSMQKLVLQIAVTIPWAVWTIPDSMVLFPTITIPRALGIIFVVFFGVGFQNAVNVTDGLDGLAIGCVLISLIGALSFLSGDPVIILTIASAIGISLGFLWHNANPASVFMGDVGAHFFAGLLLSLCVNSGALIFIIPLGFMFGIEIISVVIQIAAIRVFKRKVFLMSPIHHHFEMMGWKEPQIVARFWIIHVIGMFLCMAILFLLMSLV